MFVDEHKVVQGSKIQDGKKIPRQYIDNWLIQNVLFSCVCSLFLFYLGQQYVWTVDQHQTGGLWGRGVCTHPLGWWASHFREGHSSPAFNKSCVCLTNLCQCRFKCCGLGTHQWCVFRIFHPVSWMSLQGYLQGSSVGHFIVLEGQCGMVSTW